MRLFIVSLLCASLVACDKDKSNPDNIKKMTPDEIRQELTKPYQPKKLNPPTPVKEIDEPSNAIALLGLGAIGFLVLSVRP